MCIQMSKGMQLIKFYITRTVHIFTINMSTKNVLNKIQFMTSVIVLHVSAPGCNPQGIFRTKYYKANTLILVLHRPYSNY
jgi:hypothetical protein